jgi:hypothetical protein
VNTVSVVRKTFSALAGLTIVMSVLVAAPVAATVDPSAESDFLELINIERAGEGLAPLATYFDIADDAHAHSLVMMTTGNLHHNPDLASVTTGWSALGENVGVGPTVESLHTAFMNSPGHRANVLGDYNYIGIGVEVESAHKMWATMVFMRGPAGLGAPVSPPAPATEVVSFPTGASNLGVVDPTTGRWHLRRSDGSVMSFFYGVPGDLPMMGDWDCDGNETPGLYRQSDGFVYVRNSNSQGVADARYYFGNPGDVPLAGDFNGDGCDTVSVYRPSEARVYVINELGDASGGSLGEADFTFPFGGGDATVFAGDFDGDGVDTVSLIHSGSEYLVAGDWTGDGNDTAAGFDVGQGMFKIYELESGGPHSDLYFGSPGWMAVAGDFNIG